MAKKSRVIRPFGGLRLRPFQHAYLTSQCRPLFDAAPVTGFQVGQFREYHQHGVKIKREYSFVLKQNRNCGNVWINFDSFKNFTFDFWEAQKS